MNVKKPLLATAVFTAFSATPALADIAGTVTFLGNVQNSPCIMENDKDRHQEIKFKGLSTRVLKGTGETSDKMPFTLKFKDCTYTEGGTKGYLTFNYITPTGQADLVKVDGKNEKSLGIKITTATQTPLTVKSGEGIELKPDQAGGKVTTLNFNSEVYSFGQAVVGEFKAIANWTMHYK